MGDANAFVALGVSFGLGLLVGMQRERVRSQLAGVRTFSLITVLGTLSAILAQSYGGWVLAAGFIALAAIICAAALPRLKAPMTDPGITTEVAILLMYGLGAYIVLGRLEVAVALGGTIAVVLYAKPALHGLVRRLADKDMRALMQVVLITLVILPVLPNKPYGPFQVLNPREIWWLVTLVVAISVGGYALFKLLGERAGAVVGGLLGGVISSTATTVSYARRARRAAGHAGTAAFVIVLASTVVYVRIAILTAIVAPQALPGLLGPIGVLLLVSSALAVATWVRQHRAGTALPEQHDPAELKTAIFFGAVYAAVLFAVAAARHYFGETGVYAVAAISGLTDLDAITLSTARMVDSNSLSTQAAWRALVIAAIANLVVKACLAGILGGRKLFVPIAVVFGLTIATAVGLLLLWPGDLELPLPLAHTTGASALR